jgi:hypothetical protein
MGLSLLATASMPLKYWDQAFLTTVHLINSTPTKRICYDTPLHKLLNINPDYSNFRAFGCACWPNLRPHNTHKLQFRPIRCTFLGYSILHKGYKCLDVSTGRIYISRDVIFDEQVFPFSHLHSTTGARYTSEHLLLLRSSSSRVQPELLVLNASNTNPDPGFVSVLPVLQSQIILGADSLTSGGAVPNEDTRVSVAPFGADSDGEPARWHTTFTPVPDSTSPSMTGPLFPPKHLHQPT